MPAQNAICHSGVEKHYKGSCSIGLAIHPLCPQQNMTALQSWPVEREFDPKNMSFRRLGPSGLRVPVFSLGGCKLHPRVVFLSKSLTRCYVGLTFGDSVVGDPVKVRLSTVKLMVGRSLIPKTFSSRTLSRLLSTMELTCSIPQRDMLAENPN